MTIKKKIKSCFNILFKNKKPQCVEHTIGIKLCSKCKNNIRCDECVYKKVFETDSKTQEKCPICDSTIDMCQCKFSGSAHPDRSKRMFVVFEHLYLLTPAQLKHVIKLQKYFQISYSDDEKEKIVAGLKKEAIHPIGDKI